MTSNSADAEGPVLPPLFRDYGWWPFCLLILTLKFVLLALDASPKMFMGDSGSYLWTALSGWIPPDRSFFYGYLIRWLSISTHSLTSLLILQTFLGALTAILVALLCLKIFNLSPRLSYVAGLLCAIDPLQLVWERYVLTETISLFLYATMLAFSLYYLRQRRLWQLACVQILAVLVISFRLSYLLVVQASAIALPLIAFFPMLREGFKSARRLAGVKSVAVHLAFSLLLMFALHFAYKQLNGRLSGRPPAYLYSSGFSILAAWAPTLLPSDSPDRRLSQIISQGDQFHLSNMRLRNTQLYSRGNLLDRWKQAEPDWLIADRVAKQTALHSLLHRPTGVFTLGAKTFLQYFDFRQTRRQANSDLGNADWPKPMTATMADRFRLAPPSRAEVKSRSVLQRYFLQAQPYYYAVLFSPMLFAVLYYFHHQGCVALLFVHSSILLATDSFLAVTASVRYLQPLSFLAIVAAVLLVRQARIGYAAPQSSGAT